MQSPTSDSLVIKLLLLGDSTVGKSAFLFRYVENHFDQSFTVSIGVDTKQKVVNHKGKKLKVQVWDAAADENLSTISPAYYKAARGVIILYDITNQSSFEKVEYWKQQVDQYSSVNTPVLVVGNKTDLIDDHMISLRTSRDQEDQLSRKLGVQVCYASAKAGSGVEEAFASLIDLVFLQRSIPNMQMLSLSSEPQKRDVPLPSRCACAWWPCFKKQHAPEETLAERCQRERNECESERSRSRADSGTPERRQPDRDGTPNRSDGTGTGTPNGSAGTEAVSSPKDSAVDCQAPSGCQVKPPMQILGGILAEPDDVANGEARSPTLMQAEQKLVSAPCRNFMNLLCSCDGAAR